MRFFERLKAAASAGWRACTGHPFTTAMADGSLPRTAFRHYLVQDYLFLVEFARAYALSVCKAPKLSDMREAAGGLSAIPDVEISLHVKLCAGRKSLAGEPWAISPAVEMLSHAHHVPDTGMRGDLPALQVALGPCVIGYADIASRLAARSEALAETNPYSEWIAGYAGGPCQQIAGKARTHPERLVHTSVNCGAPGP